MPLRCPSCKQNRTSGERFCTEDGAKLVLFELPQCKFCYATIYEGNKFCAGCGEPRARALAGPNLQNELPMGEGRRA